MSCYQQSWFPVSNLCSLCVGFVQQELRINPDKKDIDSFTFDDFELVGYAPHKRIEMKMAV